MNIGWDSHKPVVSLICMFGYFMLLVSGMIVYRRGAEIFATVEYKYLSRGFDDSF